MKHPSSSIVAQFESRLLQAQEPGQIESFLEFMPRMPQHMRVRQATVFHKGDLAEHIERRLQRWSPFLERINPALPAYRLRLEYGRAEPQKTYGTFAIIPSSAPNLHRILTISYSTFWNVAIRKMISHLYPGAMPVFYKQEELRAAFRTFQHQLGPDFRVVLVDMTMKRKVRDEAATPHVHVETDRLWSELSVDDAFDQALEGGYWFTAVKYELLVRKDKQRRFSKVATGRVYKRGESNLDHFYAEMNVSGTVTLESAASARLEFLSNRSRKHTRHTPSRPLQIEYPTDLFSDKGEVRRFAHTISTYPKSTRAVFHANPYYRASIADFEDGSSMDLWILSPKRVLISPQAKTSEQALQRLISHIFYNFQEGEISEYDE